MMLAAVHTRAAARLERTVGIDAGKAECRIERGGQADHNGNRNSRAEHGPIHLDVRSPGQRLDEEQPHQVEQARSEQSARGRAKKRKKHAFGKQLAEQAGTPSADRGAHGHFALAFDAARQQKAGDIHAADGEHREHRGQERPQRAFALADDALRQQLQMDGAAPIGVGVCAAHVGEHMLQVGLRLLERDTILDSCHGAHPMTSAVLHPGMVNETRSIDKVARAQRKTEPRGHDSDNGVRQAIQFDGLVQYLAVSAEVLLPHFIAQDHDFVFAVLLFSGKPGAAQQRLHPEDLEEIIAGVDGVKQHGAVRRRLHGHGEEVVISGQGRKRVRLRALIAKAGPRRRLRVAAAADGLNADDPLGMGIRQRTQNHGVDHAEHGGGHSHAQGQRQHHRGRKAGGPAQLAQRVAKILE